MCFNAYYELSFVCNDKLFILITGGWGPGQLPALGLPILLRYLHFEEGVQHALLDFYSDSNETSEAITNPLLAKLDMSGLDMKYMSGYAADNASVNSVSVMENTTVFIRSWSWLRKIFERW